MTENDQIIVASDFLRQYKYRQTRLNYKSILKNYLTTIYPCIEIGVIKGEDYLPLLDETTRHYIKDDRNYRNDLIDFRDTLKHQTPLTSITKFTVILRFLEDNQIGFPKSFLKNLKGKENEAVSREFVPTTADIKQICEHLPIQAKTLTLVLSSSGMRPGEALELKLKDLRLDHDPPKINLPANITKTKRAQMQ